MSQDQSTTHGRAPVPEASFGTVCRRAMWWLLAHAVVIGLVLLYTAVAEAQPTPDANIGGGLGMLALAALGLPWSLPNLSGMFGDLPDIAEDMLYASCAMLNLVLHGAYWLARIPRVNRA